MLCSQASVLLGFSGLRATAADNVACVSLLRDDALALCTMFVGKLGHLSC